MMLRLVKRLEEAKSLRLKDVEITSERKEWKDLSGKPISGFRVLADGRYVIVQENKISLVSPEDKIDLSKDLPVVCKTLHVIPGERFLCQSDDDNLDTFILDSDLSIYAKIKVSVRTVVGINSNCIVGIRTSSEDRDDLAELCSYDLSTPECKTTVIQNIQEENALVLSRPIIHPITGNLITKGKDGSFTTYQHTQNAGIDEFKKIPSIGTGNYRAGQGRLISLPDGRLINYTHTEISTMQKDVEVRESRNFFQILDAQFNLVRELEIDNSLFPFQQLRLLPLLQPVLMCSSQELKALFIINVDSLEYSKIPIDGLKVFDINSRGEVVVVTNGKAGNKILFIDLECMKLYREGVFNLINERRTQHDTFAPGIPAIISACLFGPKWSANPLVEDLRPSFSGSSKKLS